MGTVQQATTSGIGAFGLICGRNGERRWIARGRFTDAKLPFATLPRLERYSERMLPAGTSEVACPGTSELSGIKADRSSVIRRIRSITCRHPSGQLEEIPVNVGSATSSTGELTCRGAATAGTVKGLHVRSQFVTAGFALKCN
jgi:hypothetical protein